MVFAGAFCFATVSPQIEIFAAKSGQAESLLNEGSCLLGKSETAEALEVFKKAAALPDIAPAHKTEALVGVAECLSRMRKFEEALPTARQAYDGLTKGSDRSFDKTIDDIQGKIYKMMKIMAISLAQQERYEESSDWHRKIMQLPTIKQRERFWSEFCIVSDLHKSGNDMEALQMCEAIEKRADAPDVHKSTAVLTQGMIYQQSRELHDVDRAIAAYEKVQTMNGTTGDKNHALNMLATYYLRRGEVDKARAAVKKVMSSTNPIPGHLDRAEQLLKEISYAEPEVQNKDER